MILKFSGKPSPIVEICQQEFDNKLSAIITKHWPGLVGHIDIIISDTMRSTVGRAYRKKSVIELNQRLLEANSSEIAPTFVHELAHIIIHYLYPDNRHVKPHGSQWKYVMQMFGYKADRCHNLDTSDFCRPRKRFEAFCQCRTYQLTSIRVNKMKRGVNYTCRTCKTHLQLLNTGVI